jgi:SAM-dependent methyltransferase
VDEADEVVWMVRGAWVSLCLRAMCELGIVDVLDEPRTLRELADLTASDAVALDRLMRVLVDLGLLSVEDGRFAATPRGEVLRVGHPSGVRNLALMQTVMPNLTAWQHLSDAVRQGTAVFEDLHGVTSWDWLAAHPEDEVVFNAAMARRGALQVAAIRAAHDFSEARLLVDVGGGEGAMLVGLLSDEPWLHGIVADRAPVAAAATTALAAAGLGERAHGEPADFFTEVPAGGDVYLLSNVLHDWDDTAATTILRTIRRAMRPDARLLVVENVLDAPGRTAPQQRDLHLVDLHMLVMFGARERTKAEYDSLLVDAGFAPSRLSPSPNIWNVLASQPAS